MKKNYLSIMTLIVVLCILLTGCGNNNNTSKSDSATGEEVSSDNNNIKNESLETSTIKTEDSENGKNITNTVLSDDLLDFQFSVNGKIIALPCTLKDITDAGFELQTEWGTKLPAKLLKSLHYKMGELQISIHAFNFSGNDYELKENTDVEDVYVTNIMLLNNLNDIDVIFPKSLDIKGATMDQVQEIYGAPDLTNGSGLYYCGSEYVNEVEIDSDNRLVMKNIPRDKRGKKITSCHYVMFYPNSDNTIKAITISTGEEIVNDFYEKYPDMDRL